MRTDNVDSDYWGIRKVQGVFAACYLIHKYDLDRPIYNFVFPPTLFGQAVIDSEYAARGAVEWSKLFVGCSMG